jgi:hypothetical protein
MHCDLLDPALCLKAGRDVIAVYVEYYGTARYQWMPAVANKTLGKSGALVFEANVFADDVGNDGWLSSDGSWKAKESDGWSEPPVGGGPVRGGVPLEIFDAACFPYGCERPGFDDTTWGNAVVLPAAQKGGFEHTQPLTDPYGRSTHAPSRGSIARPTHP